MKKLILLLITLTTLTNVSFASFPVTANNTSDSLTVNPILWGILFLTGFGFAIYFLFRLYKNSFRPWERFLSMFALVLFSIFTILLIIFAVLSIFFDFGFGLGG